MVKVTHPEVQKHLCNYTTERIKRKLYSIRNRLKGGPISDVSLNTTLQPQEIYCGDKNE